MTPQRFDELRYLSTTYPHTDQLWSALNEALDEIARLAEMVYVPGGWHCPKCGFHLVCSILYARSGNVGVDRKTPEPCPNDGTPMEPDTWKADAESMAERMPASLCMMRINDLRKNEGASVNVLCDNPDGTQNNAIEVCDEWTGWVPRRFEGGTLMCALNVALNAMEGRDGE